MNPASAGNRRVDTLLVDLYETMVWIDWPMLFTPIAERLGVDARALMVGYTRSRDGRNRGAHGSIAGDFRAVAEACGLAPEAGALEALALEAVTLGQRHIHLYDDVLPVIRRMRSDGTKVAMVSNCDHMTRPVVESLGLVPELDAVVLSCEAKSQKPEARIFELALQELGVGTAGAVFVDDQPGYLDGAAALGLRTLCIARNPSHAPAVEPARYRFICNFEEIA
jgi:HAD superfamily hydrolase (TIGR01509 family)